MKDFIAPGTTEWTQRFVRAHLPDGRIEDSKPVDIDRINVNSTALKGLQSAFGRMHLPPGTRFERLERTITVTASEWQVVDTKAEATR